MGDLDDRTFLITGANAGIGAATARALADRGAAVVLAGRSEARTRLVMDEITAATGNYRLRFLALDLGDLGSVRACAGAFLAGGEPLHCLINNAGVAGRRGLTPSGFELAFGVNHVGPFLLTSLLLHRLRESAPARIVTLASDAHLRMPPIDFDAVRRATRTRTGVAEYAFSKLANVLHVVELGRRLRGSGVTTYAVHPGMVASDIWRRVPWPIRPLLELPMRSPRDGALTPLHCATSPRVAGQTGLYYAHGRVKAAGRSVTPDHAAALWQRSEEWVTG